MTLKDEFSFFEFYNTMLNISQDIDCPNLNFYIHDWRFLILFSFGIYIAIVGLVIVPHIKEILRYFKLR